MIDVECYSQVGFTNMMCPAEGGGTKTVRIRDDAGGHYYGPNNPQNRGGHFNDEAGNHYDYEP